MGWRVRGEAHRRARECPSCSGRAPRTDAREPAPRLVSAPLWRFVHPGVAALLPVRGSPHFTPCRMVSARPPLATPTMASDLLTHAWCSITVPSEPAGTTHAVSSDTEPNGKCWKSPLLEFTRLLCNSANCLLQWPPARSGGDSGGSLLPGRGGFQFLKDSAWKQHLPGVGQDPAETKPGKTREWDVPSSERAPPDLEPLLASGGPAETHTSAAGVS